jgi:co-chaperonin GroES (HSP10)
MKELNLTELPRPAGYRVLVKPDSVEQVSPSGIITKIGSTDREQDANICGILVDVGQTAWKAYDDGQPWAQVGDRVLFAMHAGYSLKVNGVMYRMMNDQDITGFIRNTAEV